MGDLTDRTVREWRRQRKRACERQSRVYMLEGRAIQLSMNASIPQHSWQVRVLAGTATRGYAEKVALDYLSPGRAVES